MPPKTKVFIYSHTHWDREWYLSQVQFQTRLIRTLDEIIELIEMDEGIDVFVLDGQTSVIQDYLELRPERETCIKQLIADHKLAIGPWYSMPDTFLAGGEALIRNLMRGHEDCKKYGSKAPNVGYVPDSFGHIEQLPQILRGVGIDNFIFGRGRPKAIELGEQHRMEFTWEAPDGTRVLGLHMPEAYTNAKYLPNINEPDALRGRFEHIIDTHKHSHRPDLVLAAHGMDHTWLQRDSAEILKALPKLMPEVTFQHGTLEYAVDELKKELPKDLEVWRGQLRGKLCIDELHGTLSSRIDNKIWNARAQMVIENLAEPLDAIAGRYGKSSAQHLLHKAWEFIFQNHAHDSICGCSQDRVHNEVNQRYLKAAEIGTDVADSALDLLNISARKNNQPEVIVYAGLNAGHKVVDVVLRLPKRPTKNLCLSDSKGNDYPLQLNGIDELKIVHTNAEVDCFEVRACVHIPEMRPGELFRLRPKSKKLPNPSNFVQSDERVLNNGLLHVEVLDDGSLNLSDPRTGFSIKKTHYFAQDMDLGGGYHFEQLSGDDRRDTRTGKAKVRRVSKGPLRSSLEITVDLKVPARYDREKEKVTGKARVKIISLVTLEAGSDKLKVTTTIDNQAENQRIRLCLPTPFQTHEVSADASFAVHTNDTKRWPSEERQNFHPMRSFVDISDNNNGLAFVGRGQHEYEIVPSKEGTHIEVTLLRCVDFVFLCSTWKTPEAQMKGSTTHEYALCLHTGNSQDAKVAESAASFLSPAISQTSGDSLHPNETEGHATIGFYSMRKGTKVPIDTNRSTWHVTNAHRDGWRRIESGRFPDIEIPENLLPFSLVGDHLIVSAFKRAEDGVGEILRFWSAADSEQDIKIFSGDPRDNIEQVNLLEEKSSENGEATGSLVMTVRPFEIITLRFTPHPQ